LQLSQKPFNRWTFAPNPTGKLSDHISKLEDMHFDLMRITNTSPTTGFASVEPLVWLDRWRGGSSSICQHM